MDNQPQQYQPQLQNPGPAPSQFPQVVTYPPTVPPSVGQPLAMQQAQKKGSLLSVILSLIIGLIIGTGIGYALGHSSNKANTPSTNSGGSGSSTSTTSGSSSGNLAQKSRNEKRQLDISSLQTQLEAFFSQWGYYPSLANLNSTAWRSANMNSLDPNALVDPSSSCNPATTACIVASPTAKAYAYQVSNSSGGSCEQDDTKCAMYTLTANFEGTLDGASTYVKQSLN